MPIRYFEAEFDVIRDKDRCTVCRLCEKQCANEFHAFLPDKKVMISDETKCVNCQRCVAVCPTRALKIVKNPSVLRENPNWSAQTMKEIYKQAASGGVLLSSMGNPSELPV